MSMEGGQILSSFWTSLVTFDVSTGALEFDGVAESIETTDSVHYTVSLKEGWTFHDGSPVTADSYLRAWNYAANLQNACRGAYFFEYIAGYDDLVGAENADTTLTGLAKVDDHTFTVELQAAFSQ